MISRREFLKITGLSTFAFFAGRNLASFINQESNELTLISFLPENESLIKSVVEKFIKRTKVNLNIDEALNFIINRLTKENLAKIDNFFITKEKLNSQFYSDILISNNVYSVYNPNSFPEFFDFRQELKSYKAEIKLTCFYTESNLIDHLFKPSHKTLQILNHQGLYDTIRLDKNFSTIVVNGNYGKLELSVKDRLVRVTNSNCRNKHCVNSGLISQPNQAIACAPNKILLRIV